MDIYIKNKNGATLFTEKKYCEENIQVIPETEKIQVTPSIEEQIFVPEKVGYEEVKINKVTYNIDKNIQPENIKKGINILGVDGEMESGIDTSDGNIESNDLKIGKIAYSQGERIQGTYDISKDLGLAPIKTLTLSDNQTELANYYIEGFKGTDFSNLPIYQINLDINERTNAGILRNYAIYFCYIYPALIVITSDENNGKYFFNKEYTQSFINLDSQLRLGLVSRFINLKNITQEQLLQLEGWYDYELNSLDGPLVITKGKINYIAESPISSHLMGTANPSDVIKKYINLSDIKLSGTIELYQGDEAMSMSIKFALNEFMNDATIQPQDVIKGKVGYTQSYRIEGTYEPLDTSDATATAADILKDKTAYVNGVKVVGTYEESSSGDNIHNATITNITNMTSAEIKHMITDISHIDLIGFTSMKNMFTSCYTLKNISGLINTENVTTMYYCFRYCNMLENIEIFDTSSVTDMTACFEQCGELRSIPKFDTTNLDIITNCFSSCTKLETIPLLDAGKVTKIRNAFNLCYALADIGGFKNLGKAYTETTSNYSFYTLDISLSIPTHDSLMNVINNLYDLNLTYDVANGGILYTQKLVLGATNLAKLTADEIAIATAKGWTVS